MRNANRRVCGAVNSGAINLVVKSLTTADGIVCSNFILDEAAYRLAGSRGAISRSMQRLRVQVEYPTRLFFTSFWAKRGDIFVVTTNPFHALLAVKFGSYFSGAKTVWLVHDLHPEALEAGGLLRPRGFGSKMVGVLTRLSLRVADASVFLGEFLGKHAENRWGRARILRVIPPVSCHDQLSQPVEPLNGESPLRVLYSGHLGHLHAADTLITCIQTALRQLHDKVTFHFQVSGPFVGKLRGELNNENVLIESTKSSPEEHQASLASSDIALVSISPLGALAAFPSKTFSALAIGRPVLAICPVWSDLGRMIAEHEVGWVVSNSDELQKELDSDQIATRFVLTLRDLLKAKSLVAERSRRARLAFEEIGSESQMTAAWKAVVESVQR